MSKELTLTFIKHLPQARTSVSTFRLVNLLLSSPIWQEKQLGQTEVSPHERVRWDVNTSPWPRSPALHQPARGLQSPGVWSHVPGPAQRALGTGGLWGAGTTLVHVNRWKERENLAAVT